MGITYRRSGGLDIGLRMFKSGNAAEQAKLAKADDKILAFVDAAHAGCLTLKRYTGQEGQNRT